MIRDVLTEQELDAISARIGPPFEFVYRKRKKRERGHNNIIGMRGVPGGAEIHRAQVDALIEGQRWQKYRTEFAVFYSL